MRAKITKRTVDAAQPGTRDTFIWDTETKGFGLKVTPAGNRVYVVQARLNGRPVRCTIGKHGAPWAPDMAREEAVRKLGQIAAGINPNEARAEARQDLSLAELCDLYFSEGCNRKKQTTLTTESGQIERHIKPLLGKRRLKDLSRGDIERFMANVAAGKTAIDERTGPRGRAIVKGGKGAANRTFDLLASMLTFAVERGLRGDNPARGIKKYRLQSRERFLSGRDLAALGEALTAAERDGENRFGVAAIRLLILTGARKTEILTSKWDFVDVERRCLRLPDSKTGAKTIPLGAAALDVLAEIPRIEGNPYIFSSAGGKHLVGLHRVWDRIRKRAGLEDVRVHDLRHSFASIAVAGGNSLYLVGKVLGHRQSRTTEIYAHLADDPLRAVADQTAGQIAAAMEGGKADVRELPTKKRPAG
jgi:integrase